MSGHRRYLYLAILALTGFVTSFGAHVVATNLPSYAQSVGAGALMIGLLIAVYDFAELFAKPAAGFIADRHGMRGTMMAGLLVFIAGSLLFLIIDARFLLLVRFVQGLGAAALSAISITLVAKYFAQGRGRAFGIYNAIKGAGYVIAPASGGFLIQWHGFDTIFGVSAAVGCVALALSFLLPSDRNTAAPLADDDNDLTLRDFLRIFREPRLVPLYAVIVLNMFLVSILFGFLPVYLHSIGYTPAQSGTAISIATASYLLIQPVVGHLADKVPTKLTVIGGLVLAAVAVIGTPFSSGLTLTVLSIVAGIGVGTVWTNADALVASTADERRLGASVGAAQSFKELGDMVGPLLIGALTQLFSVQAGFVTCGLLALACAVALSTKATMR